YEDVFPQFGGEMTAGNSYPGYKDWVIDLLLKWHRNDQVDSKEIDRNEAVQKKQHNRNPFIDYPELVEYIWGNKKGTAFNLSASINQADMNSIHVSTREGSIVVTTSVPVHVFLYNTYGTLIQFQNGEGEIYIPTNQSGIYILKIQNDKHIITQKIRL
ncbi:MAG: endonuclease, partial [Coprobacter sp.]